jgi:hypothetical protein
MAVIERKELESGVVECLIESSNIVKTEYDRDKKEMVVVFKGGTRYQYNDVLHRDYVRFEVSESQGSVFNKTMRKYKYTKLDNIDIEPLKERIEEIKKGSINS